MSGTPAGRPPAATALAQDEVVPDQLGEVGLEGDAVTVGDVRASGPVDDMHCRPGAVTPV